MRITNSMINLNIKTNLNNNKINADKYNTILTTGQKITRPSDDPVVAIRAMKFNTSLSELNQFSEKNINDAMSWLTDTETALVQTNDLLSNIKNSLTQANSGENKVQDLMNILEEIKSLKNQIYMTGNADNTGRTVFTGCKTNESLTFLKDENINYNITEKLNANDIVKENYISGLSNVNRSSGYIESYNEENIKENDLYKIKLSYKDINNVNLIIDNEKINIKNVSINSLKESEKDKLFLNIKDDESIIVKETGELFLGKNTKDKMFNSKNIEINYEKSNWEKGDLKPEHYFTCETKNDDKTIKYNYPEFSNQKINYNIAYNQSLEININASDVFTHKIGNDIDELYNITNSVLSAEEKINSIKTMKENGKITEDEYNKMISAAEKEYNLYKGKMKDIYSNKLSSFNNYLDDVNKQITKVGTLSSRLELTKNRIDDQILNIKELADKNINADLTETAINFSNAQTALQAAQLAAAKISSQSLLNYL